MNIYFNAVLARSYHSKSQATRIMTEAWVKENIYCPRCANQKLAQFPNNAIVADFYCEKCGSEFELKSKKGILGKKIADGAYETFCSRITSYNNPDFFILSYSSLDLCVENLWFIPKHFFTPAIVEKRKPLSVTAKRAGWIGCNVLLEKIPWQGRICMIRERKPVRKEIVFSQVNLSANLEVKNIKDRGWLFDILNCVNEIKSDSFCLEEMYSFEEELALKHPGNNNIRPKIRQQLQFLRNKGVIEFNGNGRYMKKSD